MIERLKIWASSRSWFWRLRSWLGKIAFAFEQSTYNGSASFVTSKTNARILGSIAWIGGKSLFGVVLVLAALNLVESYVRSSQSWLPRLSAEDKKFNIDQLRLYAQLLTAIFSIYFATIGIILSAGYTRLRRDIIQMLTNEQVGSVYSRVLVRAAIFCLVATALPLFGVEPGLFVYAVGTVFTLLSVLALFPLGQRLFNFFDLTILVGSEILPSIRRHVEGAANPRNSKSLANHHSRSARQALDQLSYIDEQVKVGKDRLSDNLPALSESYTALLLHYLQQKHTIDQDSYWFPRRIKHQQWFFAGDSVTSRALQMSNQQLLVENKSDQQWLENEIVDRLAGHVELAFQVDNFELALKLIGRFSTRTSEYATRFQFDVGMQELKKFKDIIQQAFAISNATEGNEKIKIGIADTWAVLGSNLCLEALRRMITFEKELENFFEADEWNNKTLRRLPAFLQVDLAFIVKHIEFEQEIEGKRLSKSKYVQQVAVQKLLQHYLKVLPAVCDFYQNMVPDFVRSMTTLKMSKAATQVVLASLHSYWKLPGRFNELTQVLERYREYEHYSENQYALPDINTTEMSNQLASAREKAIVMLGNASMVKHVFGHKHDDELPDHFGQIYFELAEACISALENNDETKLNKVFPMFLSLAFLAESSKFADPLLDVNDEFRLHLFSSVINDLASVLGFAMLYGEYFDNEKLLESALTKFDAWIEQTVDKQQYLKRMVLLSEPYSFSVRASPRGLIRIKWRMSFEHRARQDGFGESMRMTRGMPHPKKMVREFLGSRSDASHLFFAKQVVPQLDSIDFKLDYHITELVRRLDKSDEEIKHEDL